MSRPAERLAAALLLLLLLAGCSLALRQATAGDTRTFVYHCPGDYRFVARLTPAEAWLFLPGETVRLPVRRSASGTRFGSGRVEFWSQGEEATLQLSDRRLSDCRNDRQAAVWEHAKLDGVDFRAVGNEPGWQLEIRDGQSLLLVTDYGARRLQFPDPQRAPLPRQAGTRYRAQNRELAIEVTLTPGPCADTMADRHYPTRVEVTLGEQHYLGCGQPLH